MAPSEPFNVLASLVSILLIYYFYRRRKNQHSFPLPPGPKRYPLIGNALDMPTKNMHERYHEWCKELGSDIIYLDVAGQGVIVLDSWEAADDLLERRSSIYSDRPSMPMLVELMGYDYNFGLIPYGDRWREQRKLMNQVFHPTAGKNLQPQLLRASHSLLRRFLESPPDNIMDHLRHLAGKTILSVAYGLDIQPEGDPYLKLSEDGNRAVTTAAVPGAFLVDALPFLKYVPEWMPGAGFKKKAREWRLLLKDMLEVPFKASKDCIFNGTFTPSFVSYSFSEMEGKKDSAWQEYLIKSTAATLYAAGSDTTASVVGTCIIALLRNPDILKRARDQVDSVVPFGELPTFVHEDKLPLITAICKEAMRWKDVVPLSLPHCLSEDDVYRGYRLPKGSVVIPNAWAMLHDEKVYPAPFEFKPDRFLKDGQLDKDARDPAYAAFGFGRRFCPGRFMAFSVVWITVASLIAAFDIDHPVDEMGNIVEVKEEYFYETLATIPKPFTCMIKPRSKKHEQAIVATANQEYQYEF